MDPKDVLCAGLVASLKADTVKPLNLRLNLQQITRRRFGCFPQRFTQRFTQSRGKLLADESYNFESVCSYSTGR